MSSTSDSYLPKGVPFLPGNTFNMQFQENRFHKSHFFDVANAVNMYDPNKPKIGGATDPETMKNKARATSVYPRSEDQDNQPAWVAFDRQVLRFDAYFQEAVHEKREEQYRIRKCVIFFYLEDDSIQVNEPKVANSGIPQGTLIRRHRIPLPDTEEKMPGREFYTVNDFNVGREVTFYSRTFKIISCDSFSRNFLNKLGVTVPDEENPPSDPYTTCRQDMLASMKPRRPYHKTDTLKQFLENDRKVLRFYCAWDDSSSVFGDKRSMTLHYFLADDTIEIHESVPSNSGRDAVPRFLKRQKMPRKYAGLSGPGSRVDQYYTDRDLVIGQCLDIFGRKFIICDCDDSTKEYYQLRYGVSQFDPVRMDVTPVPEPQRDVPPYNGFGSEEDSIGSCISLVPKPPRKDFVKLMNHDNMVLRYSARLDTTRPVDVERKFVVSYFLADDTISVYEPRQRNSGIVGGKFLERMRMTKPQGSGYYLARDLYIGSMITLMRHKFILDDADEYCYHYMEANKDQFPFSDHDAICAKLRRKAQGVADLTERISAAFGSSCVSPATFDASLMQSGTGLNPHEIITLIRKYRNAEGMVETKDFLTAVFGAEA